MIQFNDINDLLGILVGRFEEGHDPYEVLAEYGVDAKDIDVGLTVSGAVPEPMVPYVMGGILLGLKIAEMQETTY